MKHKDSLYELMWPLDREPPKGLPYQQLANHGSANSHHELIHQYRGGPQPRIRGAVLGLGDDDIFHWFTESENGTTDLFTTQLGTNVD